MNIPQVWRDYKSATPVRVLAEHVGDIKKLRVYIDANCTVIPDPALATRIARIQSEDGEERIAGMLNAVWVSERDSGSCSDSDKIPEDAVV